MNAEMPRHGALRLGRRTSFGVRDRRLEDAPCGPGLRASGHMVADMGRTAWPPLRSTVDAGGFGAYRQAGTFVDRSRDAVGRTSQSRITLDERPDDPTLYLRDLSEPNLRLADSYVGLPVRDLGVEFKKERVDGDTDYFRRWHMDIEDRRMMKMIIY